MLAARGVQTRIGHSSSKTDWHRAFDRHFLIFLPFLAEGITTSVNRWYSLQMNKMPKRKLLSQQRLRLNGG